MRPRSTPNSYGASDGTLRELKHGTKVLSPRRPKAGLDGAPTLVGR